MDLIRELANILEQDRPKSFNLLIPKSSKLKKLYKMVIDQDASDVEAARVLYESNPGDKRFIMLKGNLIYKLSELVLSANHSDINKKNYTEVKFYCETQLTIAKKLLFVNVYHNAERITNKVLKKAKSYHLAEIEHSCYVTLRKVHYLKGFTNDVEKYQQLANQKMEEVRLLDEARGMMEILLSEIKFIRSQSSKVVERCEAFVKILKTSSKGIDSPFLTLFLCRIKLIQHHQENKLTDWQSELMNIQQVLKEYPYMETEHLLLELNVSMAKFYISNRSFKEASSIIKKLTGFTSYKSFNKFEVMAELFDLHMKDRQLKKAGSVLKEVYGTLQFLKLDKMDRASWIIRSAYWYFMSLGNDEVCECVLGFNLNQMQKFYRDCAPIAKDKLGFNLQFMIIRTLLLHIKASIDYENEANNLKVYKQRYLKVAHPRVTAFYSRLTKLTNAHFSQAAFTKNSEQLEIELKEIDDSITYCEIVPFEDLWNKIGQLI